MVGENALPQDDWIPVVKCCGTICTELNCPTCGVWLPGNAHVKGFE